MPITQDRMIALIEAGQNFAGKLHYTREAAARTQSAITDILTRHHIRRGQIPALDELVTLTEDLCQIANQAAAITEDHLTLTREAEHYRRNSAKNRAAKRYQAKVRAAAPPPAPAAPLPATFDAAAEAAFAKHMAEKYGPGPGPEPAAGGAEANVHNLSAHIHPGIQQSAPTSPPSPAPITPTQSAPTQSAPALRTPPPARAVNLPGITMTAEEVEAMQTRGTVKPGETLL